MITVIEFKADHLKALNIQQRQAYFREYLTDENLKSLEDAPGDAYTVMDGDEVIAVAGVMSYGDGRGLAWSYLSNVIGNRMLPLTKAVKRFLSIANYRRIEMVVDCDFTQAHRWAKALGFTMEAERMKAYGMTGKDCSLYAMVKG